MRAGNSILMKKISRATVTAAVLVIPYWARTFIAKYSLSPKPENVIGITFDDKINVVEIQVWKKDISVNEIKINQY
jgi:hypothetical protein